LGYRDGRPLRDLCDHGQPAAARVLHKSSERRGKGGTWYHAAYAFEAGGPLEFLYLGVLGLDRGELPRPRPPRLLDQVRQVLRVRNYALTTDTG
jgi:hypothetical protein